MENYVGIKEAAEFLNRSVRTVERKIAETRAGLNNFPYYQDFPKAPYDFKLSEIQLWKFNHKSTRKKTMVRLV